MHREDHGTPDERWRPESEFARIIGCIPSADVVEVKHGEWQITDAYPHNVYCSECNERFAQTHWAVWEDGSLPRNFCPNCGADMRGQKKQMIKRDWVIAAVEAASEVLTELGNTPQLTGLHFEFNCEEGELPNMTYEVRRLSLKEKPAETEKSEGGA